MSCDKCKVEFAAREHVAKCTDCEAVFHPLCTRNYKLKNKNNFKCDLCKDEAASVRSTDDPSEDRKLILEAIHSLKKDIGSVDNKIEGIQGSIDALRSDLLCLNGKVTAIEGKMDNLQSRCDKLDEADDARSKEIHQLRLQVLDLEQHSRCANLEIVGLPVTEGEDMSAMLESVARAIKVPYQPGEVSLAHRLRLFSRKHIYPPVIVQFISRSKREAWLRASRQKKRLAASEVLGSFPHSPIYINEHLTSTNKALLGRARRLLREKKVHFASFINGKVIVKPKEGGDSVRVVQMCDLDCYDK